MELYKKLHEERYELQEKPQRYMRIYENQFKHLVNEPIHLLELGIKKGGSLLMWRDYFEYGTIVGLDVNPVELNDPTNRVLTYQGDQRDTNLLDKIQMETSKDGFDIIIDDASHQGKLTKISFWHLFDNHLKPGGIYVIEDWGTGYWGGWPDGEFYSDPSKDENHQFKSHQHGMVGFIKQLVDEQGMKDITNQKLGIKVPQRESKFQEMKISSGLVIIIKSLKGSDVF